MQVYSEEVRKSLISVNLGHKMSTSAHRPTLDGVPKQFINSLRVLFDILDEEQTGFVRLSDIETRWKDDTVNAGLPKGVVEALRKVTPASGKLTFERFIAGLKISLLRTKVPEETVRKQGKPPENIGSRQADYPVPDLLSHGPPPPPTHTVNNTGYGNSAGSGGGHGNHGYYPGHSINPDMRNSLRNSQAQHDNMPPPQNTYRDPPPYPQQGQRGAQSSQYGPITAAVRPNNAMALGQQRTKSMPQLVHGQTGHPQTGGNHPNDNHDPMAHSTGHGAGMGGGRSANAVNAHDVMSQSARPHGLRQESVSASRLGWSQNQAQPISQAGKSKDEIVSALKKWQRDRMLSDNDGTDGAAMRGQDAFHRNHGNLMSGPSTGPIDKRPLSIASTSAFEHFGRDPLLQSIDDPNDPLSPAANRRAARRKEPRRHTLANGIDYNMIKRMKQLEAEKDVLLQGLEAVERARDWYLTQIRAVQDKQKYVGKATGPHDYSVEAHQERMNFQHARISEVNQQLKALVDSSEKGFPLHMNLALSQRVKPQTENHESSNVVTMLKGQNRQLTQEVTEKSDKISQLEREKATLIRDLFESRSKIRSSNYEDTTFM